LIKQWLKAGYVEEEMLHPTETGVPQGGVISPLLLNVALHGMEQALGCAYTSKGVLRGTYALVKYADDFAVFCPSQQKAIEAQATLANWLGRRGLRLSEAKTHIRHLQEGFNFLGFTIRHYAAPNSSRSGYKLLIQPSQDSIPQLKRQRKGRWRKQVGAPPGGLLNAMKPVSRGWSNYCRMGVAKQVFTDVDDCMSWRAQRARKRRHPTTAGWWRTQQYRGAPRGARRDRWVFMDKDHNATLRTFAWTRIMRHRLVPTTSAPDDPALQDYGRQRRSSAPTLADRPGHLARRPPGRCPVCHQALEKGEELHMHHVVPKKHGGRDDLANRRLVHDTCQRQIHSTSAPLGGRRLLEPCTR
jgi:RNA-directed DNA polymerase